MTPTEEAEHTLATGIPRRQLSAAAQEEWDRIRSERDPGYQPSQWKVQDRQEQEPSLAEYETQNRQAVKDARAALAADRKVLLVRIPMMYDRLIALGTAGLPGPSWVVEAIEDLGWQLDQMSWVPRPASAFRAEGIFLFRRQRTDSE